jgi:hypothetical protein
MLVIGIERALDHIEASLRQELPRDFWWSAFLAVAAGA